jgi:integrase
MPTTLKTAVAKYLGSRSPARGTRDEYYTTLKKWEEWGGGAEIENLGRKEIREFLDWVHERAVADEGSNPGRTANKARDHLRAIISWAWEQDLIESPPRFPKSRPQSDVAGRHYLTKAELNALYFATHEMESPRGWNRLMPIGRYWRSAIVLFFNYGVDTGTVWKSEPFHEPILWRHVSWSRQSPDREVKEQSPWGWLFYRRVKTGRTFYRPMNRVVHAHVKSLMPENPVPDEPIFCGGGSRPNVRFQELCKLAGIKFKLNVETGEDEPWELKDLRKTCATYYDEHMPESSIEILGHSVGGITYRHYAHRAPLAFRAIMTIPQPTAFSALAKGYESECPCCRRQFADAGAGQTRGRNTTVSVEPAATPRPRDSTCVTCSDDRE